MSKFLLFNLDEDKAKNLGEIISSETARKIINLLAEKELSLSEISKELNLALNTTSYNIEKLKEAGLIEIKNNFWSVKGRKIPIYKLVNKNIVISPGKTLSSRIKSVIPVVLISAIFSFFIWFYEKGNFFAKKTAEKIAPNVNEFMSSVQEAMKTTTVEASSGLGITGWFLIGVWLLVVIFVVWSLRKR